MIVCMYVCTCMSACIYRSVHFDDQDDDENDYQTSLPDLARARDTVARSAAGAGSGHDSSASPGFFKGSPSVQEKGPGGGGGDKLDTSSWLQLLSQSPTLRNQNHLFKVLYQKQDPVSVVRRKPIVWPCRFEPHLRPPRRSPKQRSRAHWQNPNRD